MGDSLMPPGGGEMSPRATRGWFAGGIRLRHGVVVLALAALLIFPRLGERALWGPEGRWAEITREMQVSGNYFWPTINGAVYYDKPLLSYWLAAGAASLTGTLNELAVRLPSAVSGLLGVALLMLLGRRLYGLPTAIVASLILATSYSYVYFSRLASADMQTVAGVLAAFVLFVYGEKQPKGRWLAGFWLIMAVASLTKGLIGFALPLLVAGVYSLSADGWRGLLERGWGGSLGERLRWFSMRFHWFFNWWTLPAAGGAVLVYCLPFAMSYLQVHSNVGIYEVFHENIVRFVDPFDHQEPVYLYLYGIFFLMAPWSIFLPAALVQMHAGPRSKGDRFALSYFWATFLFFSLSGSRRDYYLLPILPAGAILIARLLMERKETLTRYARKLMDLGFVLMALLVVGVGALALLPPSLHPTLLRDLPALPEKGVFAVFWLVQLAFLGYAFFGLRPARVLLSTSVTACLCLLFLFLFSFPASERYRGERTFAYAVRAKLRDDTSRLILYKVWGPGLLFYLSSPKPVAVYSEGTALAQVIESDPDRWVILHERELKSFPLDYSIAEVSQAFLWKGSPRLSTEYVLLRSRTVAEANKEGAKGRH